MKKITVILAICVLLSVVMLLTHAQSAEYTAQAVVERTNATLGLALSPDGSKLIVGGGPVMIEGRDGYGDTSLGNSITVYDFETGELLHQFDSSAFFVADIALSPDGNQIIAALSSNTVGILDVETGEILRQYEGIASAVLDVSPDGQLVISNARGAHPILWNFETGEIIHQFDETTDVFGPVAFSPDGQLLAIVAAASESNALILWDTTTNSEIYRLVDLPLTPDIEFSPDSQLLAMGTLGEGVRVVFASNGDVAYEFKDYQTADGTVNNDSSAVSFSADGEQLASAWNGTDIALWDFGTSAYTSVGSHESLVWRIVFSSDGSLWSSSYDGKVNKWVAHD